MEFREISYLESTLKSVAKFMFLLKSDDKTVYMKICVHARVFFFNIMERDGVLCELGAEAYGTIDDLNFLPLTR